jgi:nitrate reductase gamma subunit
MPLTELLAEAKRVMTICNACRYCEGYCAVFPAIELRRTFSDQDLKYLANLCHNCRDCYYACQYAPPHEFALNVPKSLDGGGQGCNYPDDRFSMIRRWFHHFAFYGFMLCFASTTVAAIYDHFLHRAAPYQFWSWPVMLGTIGGVALLIGTGGLLFLKSRMDTLPASPRSFGMDVGFLVLLFLVNLTGLLLLALRARPVMGTLLAVHLGLVAGLFITMPYGKFVHAVYRYAALVRNAIEQSREER